MTLSKNKQGLEVYTRKNAIKWNSNGGADRTARPWIVRRVAELGCEGKATLLDIGSGTGRWTRQFAQYMDLVRGMDISPEMIKIARKTNSAQNIEYICGDVSRGDLGQCDIITALASLQYSKSREELNTVYAKIRNSLTNGGHFLFYVPHPIGVFAGKTKVYLTEFDSKYSYNDNFSFTSKIAMEDGTIRRGSGYHHSMAEYTSDLNKNGFRIVKMEEFFAEGEKIPNALVVDALKLGAK
jgi:SAM-dependent methyltransferase